MSAHRELERRFAAFKGAEDALMFQSGFTSNAGTVAAILSKTDVIVSDELNHASIIDGARLSRAEIKVFPHKDAEATGKLLAETAAPGRHQLLITDGVFSMDGDIAPLPDLVRVAREHDAIMMIDDAHASGVLGKNGKGTVSHSASTRWRSTSRSGRCRRPSASSAGSSPAASTSSNGW
jgi:glycine C-acetyltransferase